MPPPPPAARLRGNTKGYSSTYLAMGFAHVRAGTSASTALHACFPARALAPARACRCVVSPFRFFTRACCSAALQWQVVSLIYAGKAAYSLVVPLTNTTIGVVYERE